MPVHKIIHQTIFGFFFPYSLYAFISGCKIHILRFFRFFLDFCILTVSYGKLILLNIYFCIL